MTTAPYVAFRYIDTDIPAGMTVGDWRRARCSRKRRTLVSRLSPVHRSAERRLDLPA